MKILYIYFYIFLVCLLACKNQSKNILIINETEKNDSISPITNQVTITSYKSIEELLKNGQKGVFEDSTFSAIIETDFGVSVTNPAFHNYEGYINVTYQITSYVKEGNNWKTQSVISITSDSTKYKCIGSDVKIADMDNDGKKDILILTYGDGRNKNYKLFLFKDKHLVEVEDFEELANPTYDSNNKVISTYESWHGGHLIGMYQVIRDSLIFIESTLEDFDRDGDSLIIKKTVGAKKQ